MTTASDVSGNITHNANNELEHYGDISFSYDANGNMVGKTSASENWTYTYNVQNRLVRVEEDDLLIAEYGYDPFGRRLWKEVEGIRTYFLYSDEGLVAEYDEDGAEIRSYGYKPDSTWGTDPLWLKEDGEYYWYQNDHLGTPQKLVGSSGTVVWSATYTAFGEAQVEIETVTNNLRFPGQYYDAETGLHYNWQRYYDPKMGRYTQVDPIGFDGGDLNLYGYVGNNPLAWSDAYGLWFGLDDLITGPVDEILVLGLGYLFCRATGGCQMPDLRDVFPAQPVPGPTAPGPAPVPGPTPEPICEVSPYPSPMVQPVPPIMPLPVPEPLQNSRPPGYKGPIDNNPGPDAAPGSTPYTGPPYGGPATTPTPPPEDPCKFWKHLFWKGVNIFVLKCNGLHGR